jgi:hypothetical protein
VEYEAIPRDGTNKMAKLNQKIAIALQISLSARLGILDHECEKVAGNNLRHMQTITESVP